MSLVCLNREGQYRGEPRGQLPRVGIWAFACLALFLILPLSGKADDGQVRELLVDQANTPEEHAASARYYAGKAQESRHEVVRHQEMGERYSEGKMKDRRKQKTHCENIASLHVQLVSEYEALARNHRDETKRQEQGTEGKTR